MIRRIGCFPACSWILAAALLSACTPPPATPGAADEPFFLALESARVPTPSGAPKDSCWARDATPAVIETVTDQVVVQPAMLNEDGSLLAPAIYATETRQEIVVPRKEFVFQTLCPEQITPEFVASLQRAFQARGKYSGQVTGEINAKTEDAIRSFQLNQGLKTRLLTIETARTLGLVAVERT